MFRKLFGIGALSPTEFARLVAEMGVEMGRFTDPKIDVDEMTIVDARTTISLQNTYKTFLALPRRHRRGFIERGVLADRAPVIDVWDEAKKRLVANIRDGAYLRHAALQGESAGEISAIAHRNVAPNLYATIVIDSPLTMMFVNDSTLADWDVSFEIAFDIALARLRDESVAALVQVAPGVWRGPWDDSFTAARILLPEVLRRVCDEPIIAVPDRDTLLVADPSVEGVFAVLVALLYERHDKPYPITRQLYQLRDDGLHGYEPRGDDQAHVMYGKLVTAEILDAYNQERKVITSETAYYATLMGVARGDDVYVTTTAIWQDNLPVPTYLPPAQLILFAVVDGEGNRVVWEAPFSLVLQTPGMLTLVESTLPRWRTGAFPTAAWLEKNCRRADGGDLN